MKRISNATKTNFKDLAFPQTVLIQLIPEFMIYVSCILMDLFWVQCNSIIKSRMCLLIGVVVFIMQSDKRPVDSVT